jgi:hypothetical protein
MELYDSQFKQTLLLNETLQAELDKAASLLSFYRHKLEQVTAEKQAHE